MYKNIIRLFMVLVLIPNLVYSNKRGSMETIYLAGGCYWGLEELIRNIPGVEETQVGVSGGHIKNVTYKEVSSGESGHAESIKVIFNKSNINDTLGEILERNNKKQLRITETEKYPHVTFFFSGGREDEFIGESRILENSPKVATYDLKPEMSAFEITDSLLEELDLGSQDFICLNYANGDMVGHTGSMKAAIKACEAVDKCVEKVVESALKNNYTTILIADHGNCETMINPDGSPNTAHTTNPVPVILIDKKIKKIKNGILGDIAPTILKLMGIDKPTAMTQESLV